MEARLFSLHGCDASKLGEDMESTKFGPVRRPATSSPSSQSRIQRKVLDVGVVVLLGAVLLAVGLFGVIAGMKLTVSHSEVEVPSLRGLTLKAAENELQAFELALRVAGERYDAGVPSGAILSQFPPAGTRSKPGRTVQAILSKGTRTHPVPDLIGSTAGVAKMTSEQSNYVVGRISTITVPRVAKDTVLAQSPPPGSTSAVTPRIDVLMVSGEASRYIMPDFVGLSLNRVKPFLEKHELKLEEVHYRFHQSLTKGTVIGQFPRPGHMLKADEGITLEVAR